MRTTLPSRASRSMTDAVCTGIPQGAEEAPSRRVDSGRTDSCAVHNEFTSKTSGRPRPARAMNERAGRLLQARAPSAPAQITSILQLGELVLRSLNPTEGDRFSLPLQVGPDR